MPTPIVDSSTLVPNDLLCFLHSYSSLFTADQLRDCIINEFSLESVQEALSLAHSVLGVESTMPTLKGDVVASVVEAHEQVDKLRQCGKSLVQFVSRDLRTIPFPCVSAHVLGRILEELETLKDMIGSKDNSVQDTSDLSLTVDCGTHNTAPPLNNSGNSGTSSEISPTKVLPGSSPPDSPSEGLLGIKSTASRRRGLTNLESAVQRLKQRKFSPTTPPANGESNDVHKNIKDAEFACKTLDESLSSSTDAKCSKNTLPTGSTPNFGKHVNESDWAFQQQWYHAYMSSMQNFQMMLAQKQQTNHVNPLSGLSLLPPSAHAMHSPPTSLWPSGGGWTDSGMSNGRSSKISPNTATATSSVSGGDVASSVAGHSIKEELDDSPELDDDDMDDEPELDGETSPVSDIGGLEDGKTKSGVARNCKLLNDAIDKPHECPYPNCSKRFANKFLWKKHVFIHTGERPYECQHCHKKFNRKDNLLRHKKTHNSVNYGQPAGVARRRVLGETSPDNGSLYLQPAMAQLLAAAAAASNPMESGENKKLLGLLNVQSHV